MTNVRWLSIDHRSIARELPSYHTVALVLVLCIEEIPYPIPWNIAELYVRNWFIPLLVMLVV